MTLVVAVARIKKLEEGDLNFFLLQRSCFNTHFILVIVQRKSESPEAAKEVHK